MKKRKIGEVWKDTWETKNFWRLRLAKNTILPFKTRERAVNYFIEYTEINKRLKYE